MPIRDVAAMNRSLDNDYGTTAGPNAPSSWELALFVGDPMVDAVDGGGIEAGTDPDAPCPGYARVLLAQSDFVPAVDGMKKLSAPALYPAPTAAWDATITHWALFEGGTTEMWDCGPLGSELDITDASGAGPAVDISIFYDDSVEELA